MSMYVCACGVYMSSLYSFCLNRVKNFILDPLIVEFQSIKTGVPGTKLFRELGNEIPFFFQLSLELFQCLQ